ncbi:MAG: hypothetical protein ABIW76_20130 [Fibrobacteria bacterium]
MKWAMLGYTILSLTVSVFSGTVSDPNLGYAITLPSSWVQLKTKPEQHYFRDGAKQYRSQISILKYAIDNASYPTPESWTQAQFIAYKLSVETSSYPFGAIAYFDSTSTEKLGTAWAPEAFSVLYPADGTPTYCEYMRYCAVGSTGYEIYAIGDSTDMTTNVDFYASIISTLQFSTPNVSIAPLIYANPILKGNEVHFNTFDLSGRKIPKSMLSQGFRTLASQRFISKVSR